MTEKPETIQSTQQSSQNSRYMPSIFQDCDKFKREYNNCFTEFFQKFVSSDYKHETAENPCQESLNHYRECVEKHLELYKPYDIDLSELRKEVLENIKNEENPEKVP